MSDADKNGEEIQANTITLPAYPGVAHDANDTAGNATIKAVPLYRLNAPPRYPRRARLRGYEGKVLMDVLVGADGSVLDLKIDVSSGYDILDRASLQAVQAWRFEPAHLWSKPIAMWVKVPVRFQLK